MLITKSRVLWLALGICAVLPARSASLAVRIVHGADAMEVEPVSPNIVRIHFQPGGKTTARTLVMDPAFQPAGTGSIQHAKDASAETFRSGEMRVLIHEATLSVDVQTAGGTALVSLKRGRDGGIVIQHDGNERLYGIHGLDISDDGAGIVRTSGGGVAAGVQGNAGGPFLFTTNYGVLIDSDGGSFQTHDETIRFSGGSRPDTECFLIVGPPLKAMAGLALLTGRPPMPPKWTLGFLNSQWGSTEAELLQIAATYQEKSIPLSGFILDFDWKAWGEDDYGEWRWNSTSGPGNSSPNKFPNGASGKFAAGLLDRGVHLAGILKPRILMSGADGKPTQAAQYATEHKFWYPNEQRGDDYFTHRPAANLDFGNPETRKWFFEKLVPAFRAGMAGWWNDEADRDNNNVFSNFQFLNMARALYEGQRAISNERAWSINRNYYPGALRYSYAEWSGDIGTGFQSMAYQRRRMIATLNLGEPAWSMDTGGFNGHPTAENYARWMEFAAFVPVFRVHGGNDEKRQPWVYGPIAEAAAKRVMRLRYDLLPYIYSYARATHETGIGLVRPLFWEFPADDHCAEETSAWMFGDALLVSPIVEMGRATHRVYLPKGAWLDYTTGARHAGEQELNIPADAAKWQDVPLFIRQGSILASQPAAQGNDLSAASPLILDVFPSAERKASFVVYDDDGHTYAYESGEFFRQEMTATAAAKSTSISFSAATGAYKPHFPSYILRVHQGASKVSLDAAALARSASLEAFQASRNAAWFASTDRFGAVTEIRIPAGAAKSTVVVSGN